MALSIGQIPLESHIATILADTPPSLFLRLCNKVGDNHGL
ncbi:hypothetical protein L747_13390 [Levilactobacillus brevis BSO 464]|nr:hypothetical protein L747_13390 [Levilactobacillus brevis BSO 464]